MFVLSIIVVFGVAGWFKIEPEVCEASIPIAEGFRLLALLVALATYFMEQYSYYNGFTKEEYLTSIENSNIQDAAKDVEIRVVISAYGNVSSVIFNLFIILFHILSGHLSFPIFFSFII